MDWCSLVEEFRASGLSQRVFCEQKGLKQNQFKYWLYGNRDKDTSQAVASTSFVKIKIPVAAQPLFDVSEICYPNGVRIKLQSVCDLQVLRSLISLV